MLICEATIANRLTSFTSGVDQRAVKRHYDFAFWVNLINLKIISKGFQCQTQACVTAGAVLETTLPEMQVATRFYQRDSGQLTAVRLNRLPHARRFRDIC